MHPVDLLITVTHARDFETAELEANHAQAVNLVMNGSSELDSKLKQFISRGSQKHMSATTVVNKTIFKLIAILIATNDQEINTEIPIATTNLSTTNILTSSLSTATISNLSTAASSNLLATVLNNLSVSTINPNTAPKLCYDDIRKPKIQNCSKLEIGNGCSSTDFQLFSPKLRTLFSEFGYSLLVTPENTTPNNWELEQTPASNIPSATITEDESLDAIFPFELKELLTTLLFSGAALEEKPITAMYTDAKIDGHPIKLILDSGSADSIITRQFIDQLANGVTKTPIGEIDDLPIEINDIIVPIKVLIMEATQYQTLVDECHSGLEHTKATTQPKQMTHAHISNKEDKGKGKEKEEVMPPTATIYNSYTHHTPQQSDYR
ncbi:hypothetical protein G9A89_003061 [Geosiphon pyriformis]|nr:hypothetical protein G9A89_003061 [Geosiphon pyriformis]